MTGALVALAPFLAVLAVANVVSNRLLPPWSYIPVNLAVAALLVVMARRSLSNDLPSNASGPRPEIDRELGLGEWRRGAAFGAVLAAATLVVMLVGLTMPALRGLYADERVDGSVAAVLYQALVRVPLGTVVLEEIAFRSVLPAIAARRLGVLRGSALASVAFGFWHVLPAWNLNDANQAVGDLVGTGAVGTAVTVAFGVIGTTFAGLWWCWIRYRARSVLATVLAHTATNSIGYLLAFVVTR